MSTEYRRGIPGTAHVEAATRLGLLWRGSDEWLHRFRNQNGQIEVWYFEDPNETPDWEAPDFAIEDLDFRPIRTDGTPVDWEVLPVDWEVLDQEVARMGQPQTMACNLTAPTQPQGFRADLWARICDEFNHHDEAFSLKNINAIDVGGRLIINGYARTWPQPFGPVYDSILTRWTVYQELKPLYDIVDGAQSEVVMPRDVEAEWHLQATTERDPLAEGGRFGRDTEGVYLQCRSLLTWRSHEDGYGVPLRNFAAVLDAVAEQRAAARQGQANPSATLRTVTAAQPAAPEPRSFADVRPDRHVHKRWRLFGNGCGDDGCLLEINSLGDRYRTPPEHRWWEWASLDCIWNPRTIIPTDEQGNPVSWESINETARILQTASSIAQQASQQILGSTVTVSPTTGHVETPLPRFTADELDDVDHSATTTQDSATLKRGKLPTVEAIGKYREVMAKRNGTVAEAVKASGIDCEVAQYVLERWAGGLSDREAEIICDEAYGAVSFTRADIAKRLSHWFAIRRPTLDTSEPADTAAQRQRAEAAERKARMAALQAQLAKERAARIAEPEPELSRFALLEVDEAADPSKSIEAWKAQRAANERRARNTVRPVTVTSPPPAPKRKPFEVVDAQADGLSGGAAFVVLLSRAMNQNC